MARKDYSPKRNYGKLVTQLIMGTFWDNMKDFGELSAMVVEVHTPFERSHPKWLYNQK